MSHYYCYYLGLKAQEEFDSILSRILRSDWSTDFPPSNSYYVTWGANQQQTSTNANELRQFGRGLGRLSDTDLASVVSKAIVTFGESISTCTIAYMYRGVHVHVIYT